MDTSEASRTRMFLKDTKNKSARWQASTEGILPASACDAVLSMKQRAGQAEVASQHETVQLRSIITKPWAQSSRVLGDGVRVAFDLLIEHEAAQPAANAAADLNSPSCRTCTAALPVECLQPATAIALAAADSLEPLPKIYQFTDIEAQQLTKGRRERLLRSGLLKAGGPNSGGTEAGCTDARSKSFTSTSTAASMASRSLTSSTTNSRGSNTLSSPSLKQHILPAASTSGTSNPTSTLPRSQPSSFIFSPDGCAPSSMASLDGLDPQLAGCPPSGLVVQEGCIQALEVVSEEAGTGPTRTPHAPPSPASKNMDSSGSSISGPAGTSRSRGKQSVLTERIKRTGQAFASLVQKLRPSKVQIVPVTPERTAGQLVEGSQRDVHSMPTFLFSGLGHEQPTQFLLSGTFLEPGTVGAQTEPMVKPGAHTRGGASEAGSSAIGTSMSHAAQATSAPHNILGPRSLQCLDAPASSVQLVSSQTNAGTSGAPDSPGLTQKSRIQVPHNSTPAGSVSAPVACTNSSTGWAKPITGQSSLNVAGGGHARWQGPLPGKSCDVASTITTVRATVFDSVLLPGAASASAAEPAIWTSTQVANNKLSAQGPARTRRASIDGPCCGPFTAVPATADLRASTATPSVRDNRRASIDSMLPPRQLHASPARLAIARAAPRANFGAAISAVIIAKTQPAPLPTQQP